MQQENEKNNKRKIDFPLVDNLEKRKKVYSESSKINSKNHLNNSSMISSHSFPEMYKAKIINTKINYLYTSNLARY